MNLNITVDKGGTEEKKMPIKEKKGPMINENELKSAAEKFAHLPVVVEGSLSAKDLSYFLIDNNDDMKGIEKGIPLAEFKEQAAKRDSEMEYRLLCRIT